MMSSSLSAWFLVGPTAVGKTAVAQALAERQGQVILSADSMQVYRGMDIGTAKPSPIEQARVRTLGIDLVDPDKSFSAGAWRQAALDVLREAGPAGVVVAGGTGLYVKALVQGLVQSTPVDPARREHWEEILAERGPNGLREALAGLDREALDRLQDPQNPRRLIRALERAESGTSAPDTWGHGMETAPLVGLSRPASELNTRIEQRVKVMYAEGLVEEVRGLRARFPAWSVTAEKAIGYAESLDVLAGRCTQGEAMTRTIARTRRLAKRQRTWFRHQANVCWVEAGSEPGAVIEEVLKLWRTHGPTRIAE